MNVMSLAAFASSFPFGHIQELESPRLTLLCLFTTSLLASLLPCHYCLSYRWTAWIWEASGTPLKRTCTHQDLDDWEEKEAGAHVLHACTCRQITMQV